MHILQWNQFVCSQQPSKQNSDQFSEEIRLLFLFTVD